MSNDRIVITGGSSGIGQSLVEHLADDFEVLTFARRLETMTEMYADYESVHPYRLDLTESTRIQETLERVREEHGPIHYLINNAAMNVGHRVEDISATDIERSVAVNATAPSLLLQSVLPDMKREDFGRVINVTSGAPLECPTGASPYSASKAALNILTVTAAKELSTYDIKINLMSPGPCKTEMAPDAPLDPSECHPTVDYLLSLPENGPTGEFFWLGHRVPLFPDLGDVEWEQGEGSDAMEQILDQ